MAKSTIIQAYTDTIYMHTKNIVGGWATTQLQVQHLHLLTNTHKTKHKFLILAVNKKLELQPLSLNITVDYHFQNDKVSRRSLL